MTSLQQDQPVRAAVTIVLTLLIALGSLTGCSTKTIIHTSQQTNVNRYALDVVADPSTGNVQVDASLLLEPLEDATGYALLLDQVFTVDWVTIDGETVPFEREGESIVVTPTSGVDQRPHTLNMSYHGTMPPDDETFYARNLSKQLNEKS